MVGHNLKYYLIETFEPTLLFGLFLSLLGVAAARRYGSINPVMAALAVVGVILLQIAVNLIDDYEDYSSGLDKETVKTKFSGGSELLTKKLVKPKYVLAIGMTAFILAALIGVYLISKSIVLLPIALVGGISALFYAKYLAKVPLLSEPITGLNFALVCFGCFIAAGGSLGSATLFTFAAIAAGFQVAIAVIVNYMPDRRSDRKHGRRGMVVLINSNAGAAVLYLVFQAMTYLLVMVGVLLHAIPIACLFVIINLPVVMAIAYGVASYKDPKSYERVMANATMEELVFILVLAIAFV